MTTTNARKVAPCYLANESSTRIGPSRMDEQSPACGDEGDLMPSYKRALLTTGTLLVTTLLVSGCVGNPDDERNTEPVLSSSTMAARVPEQTESADGLPQDAGGQDPAAGASFAIGMSNDEQVTLRADGTMLPLEFEGEPIGVWHVDWASDGSAAAIGGGFIAHITSEGVQALAPCEGCAGAAAVDGLVVSAQTSYIPGVDFHILRFDTNLELVDQQPARHAPSRHAVEDVSGGREPQVWTASPEDGTVITYLAPDGMMRGGPDTVAVYDAAGELADSVTVMGRIDRMAKSPQGRALAVVGWSSGGGCHTDEYLTIILKRGQKLTSILFSDLVSDNLSYMEVLDIQWQGSTLKALAHLYPTAGEEGTCDEPSVLAELTYELESNLASVTSPRDEVLPRTHLGEQCEIELRENFATGEVFLGKDAIPGFSLEFWPPTEPCSNEAAR